MVIKKSNSMTNQQLTDRSNRNYHGQSSRFMGSKCELQHHKAAAESDESEDDELPVLPRQPIPVI
jgi:hypothetical protein